MRRRDIQPISSTFSPSVEEDGTTGGRSPTGSQNPLTTRGWAQHRYIMGASHNYREWLAWAVREKGPSMYDFAVIGADIVGLSSARALVERYPSAGVVVLEKESGWAHHQTGHNA